MSLLMDRIMLRDLIRLMGYRSADQPSIRV